MRDLGVSSSLKVWQNLKVNPCSPRLFFFFCCWKIFYYYFILFATYLNYLYSLDLILMGHMFIGKFLFFLHLTLKNIIFQSF